MLIPLGFWAASGASVSTGAFEQIASSIISGTTNTVTFSSIPQTYKHLQLRITYQVNTSTTSEYGLTINPNSGVANSAFHWLAGNGTSVYSTVRSATNTANYGLIPYVQPSSVGGSTINPSTYQSQFVTGIVDILDYASTTKNKTFKSFSGHTVGGTYNVSLASMLMADTAAITQLSMYASNAPNYTVGSRFSLYGIKG